MRHLVKYARRLTVDLDWNGGLQDRASLGTVRARHAPSGLLRIRNAQRQQHVYVRRRGTTSRRQQMERSSAVSRGHILTSEIEMHRTRLP